MTAFVISNAGGNWNAPGSYVANSGFPVAGDTVTATGTSGNLTVNVASSCASLILTNYTNTLTMTNSLTMTSTLTLVSGQANIGGAGAFIMNGTLTITSGGKTIPALTLQGANTYTLGDDLTVAGLVSVGSGSSAITLTGSKNLNCNGSVTGNTTGTITFSGLTALNLKGTGTFTFGSGTWTNGTFNIQTGASTLTLSGANATLNGTTMSYTSGTVAPGTSIMNIAGNVTFTLGASAHLFSLTFTSASTVTLGADLYLDGTLTFGNQNDTFAGAFNIIAGTVAFTAPTAARTHTMVQGQTLTINTAFSGPTASTNAVREQFVSSSPGTKWKLVLANGATQFVVWVNFTDCDATGGQTIFDAAGAVITCFNIQSAFAPVQLRREPIMQLVH